MRITRRRGGAQLSMDPGEAKLLARLIENFVEALEADEIAAGDPVHERLFPAGYTDDQDAAEEFRSLTEATLRGERCARAHRCISELAERGEADRRLHLDPEGCERWLKVLNDVRLALGTRLQVSEDDDEQFDPRAPDAEQRSLYVWLTATQDGLVRAVMG